MRKTTVVTITGDGKVSPGRDLGKSFLITEMPASMAEDWAFRAFLALAKAGVQMPDDVASSGMAGLASADLSMLGHIPYADAAPLYAQLLACVQIMPNPSDPSVRRPLIEDDIEEVATRVRLRWEALKLHVDFFAGGDKPPPK